MLSFIFAFVLFCLFLLLKLTLVIIKCQYVCFLSSFAFSFKEKAKGFSMQKRDTSVPIRFLYSQHFTDLFGYYLLPKEVKQSKEVKQTVLPFPDSNCFFTSTLEIRTLFPHLSCTTQNWRTIFFLNLMC